MKMNKEEVWDMVEACADQEMQQNKEKSTLAR